MLSDLQIQNELYTRATATSILEAHSSDTDLARIETTNPMQDSKLRNSSLKPGLQLSLLSMGSRGDFSINAYDRAKW